jgi:hypothetical protein
MFCLIQTIKNTVPGFEHYELIIVNTKKSSIYQKRLTMKKMLIACFVLAAFVLPLRAQDHDFNANDREPVINQKITKEQVPEAVQIAFNNRFDPNVPQTWSKFPYALKEYGWVYDVGASNVKLDRYVVSMKDSKGNDLMAIYNVKGELVETSEITHDGIVPPSVMSEFLNSKYKDWKIVGNKQIINFYHDHNNSSVEQHVRLTVEKDGVKRAISFNWQGSN